MFIVTLIIFYLGAQIVCAETIAVPHWYIDQPDNTDHTVFSGEIKIS